MSDPHSNFWRELAKNAKYTEVNKTLNGLPDYLRQNIKAPEQPERASYGAAGLLPALPQIGGAASLLGAAGASAAPLLLAAYGIGKAVAPEATEKAIEQIKRFAIDKLHPVVKKAEEVGSAYEQGMVESVPGARAAKKWLVPQGAQDYMERVKAQHPIAATAGQVAGTAGQMAIGGAGLGSLVKGAGFLPTVGRAALSAAPYAAATGLDVGATTGSASEGLKAAATTEGLATAGGALGGAIAKWAPGLAEKLSKVTNRAEFASRGLAKRQLTSAFNKAMPFGAGPLYKVQRVEQWTDDMADFLRDVPRKEGAAQALARGQDEAWAALDEAWKGVPIISEMKAGDIVKNLTTAGDIVKLSKSGAGDTAAIQARDILSKGDARGGLTTIRGYLRNMIDAARMGKFGKGDIAPNTNKAVEYLAHGIDQRVGEMAMKAAEAGGTKVDLGKLKKFYNLSMPLYTAEIMENLTPLRLGMGSPTMEKLKTLALISGPSAVGGTIEGIRSGKDDIPASRRLLQIGGASLAGPLLMKGASMAGLRGISALSKAVPALTAAAGPIAARAPEITSKVASTIGLLANQVLQRPPEERQDAIISQTVDAVGAKKAGEVSAIGAGAAAGDAAVTGDPTAYHRRITNTLRDRWMAMGMERWYPGQLDYFMKWAGEKTANAETKQPFDPRKTAHLAYSDPEERKKFLDAFTVAETLSRNVRLAETRTMEKGPLGLLETGKPAVATEKQREAATAYQMLQDIMKERAPKTPGEVGVKTGQRILDDILKNDKLTTAEKQRQIQAVLASYGVSFDLLKQAGLA